MDLNDLEKLSASELLSKAVFLVQMAEHCQAALNLDSDGTHLYFDKDLTYREVMTYCRLCATRVLDNVEKQLFQPEFDPNKALTLAVLLIHAVTKLEGLNNTELEQPTETTPEKEMLPEGPSRVLILDVQEVKPDEATVAETPKETLTEKPVKAERQPPKAGRWTEVLAKVLGRPATVAENNRIYGAVGKPYLVLEDTVEEILKGLEDYGEIPTTGQIKLLADVAQTLKGLGSTESIDFIWLAETMKNQLTEGLSLKATLDALVKLYTEKHPLKGKECRKEQSSGSKRINLKRLGEKGFDDDAVQEVTNALGGYVISTKPMGFLVGFARKYKQTLTQAAELMMKIDPELKLDFISLDEQMAGLLKQIKRHTANPTSQGEGGRSKV